MKNKFQWHLAFMALLFCIGCADNSVDTSKLFSELSSSETGIDFENTLTYDRKFNIYTYRNFYNGGGVAIGDINGDTLADIYFSANMGPNKLYLNKGGFKFEDISSTAGVEGDKAWSTGVTMADVNSDGHLDIYVCNSGDVNGDNKSNELFINDGTGKFTEQAAKYGLDDTGYSTHAVFFDFDKDGDLDMYLLNNSYQAIGSFNLRDNKRNIRDNEGGDKLFRNDENIFTDVSKEAGIYGSVIGFGLGITVGDINGDHWPDIYVSNDFFERDYIYINNQDGTFSEDLEDRMTSISAASMGADMADINNDGRPDIFVTEMLPGTDERLKTKTTFDDWDKYNYSLKNGYYHQFNRNMLQMGESDHTFTEVGRHMGVHATDWSWGALISDFDNDGWKDLFIANGIYQDLTDQDFLNYIADGDVMKSMIQDSVVNYEKLIGAIPSNKIENYLFHNKEGKSFENAAARWGLDTPSHSNGSAYGDLDNDGDLDLIVNNVNMPPFIYRNNSKGQNWIQIKLLGEGQNTQAINSKIEVITSNGNQYFEFMPQKGFQSSMDYITHVGLGGLNKIDEVGITWPDGRKTIIKNLTINQRYTFDQRESIASASVAKESPKRLLSNVTDSYNLGFTHKENKYVDFDRERLLYNMKSTPGPAVAVADFNNDGKEDLLFGGAANQPSELWVQRSNGQFRQIQNSVFEEDKNSEVQDLLPIDFDKDGDLDVLSIHGGIEFTRESSALKDQLYLNNGSGQFSKSSERLPNMGYQSNKAITSGDYNRDKQLDIFVGEGLKPFLYGVPGQGQLLMQSEGKFLNVAGKKSPDFKQMGLINDAATADLNGDGFDDLIVVGDYMPVHIYMGSSDGFMPLDTSSETSQALGWWNTIKTADLDNDGDLDIIAGNHGTNTRFKADKEHPVCMHINDFDQNGSVEQIVCIFSGERSLPLALRHDLVKQLPGLKKRYLKYDSYVDQTMEDMFSAAERAKMITLRATEMRSMVFLNENGKFKSAPLPTEAQLSAIYAIEAVDLNADGILDLILGGNLYNVKPEVGRYDATDGVVLLGLGDGTFSYLDDTNSGFIAPGEIRAIKKIDIDGSPSIVVARNNDTPLIFQLN
ncbi:MAG: VCBS repeat-containing protein [Bacteroidota bacterium]